ncbi:cobalamin biosynthesis protein CobT [Gluconacetobacter johannae DSM 13595]|uniref:Cobaltochelatase subunit CobT n=1 Tax=Gluconacetobacter johannae TaxID=112140 RepID=A0A7W4P705_9PROT|nr:cobaltochelatase subunit CobT [Gluconacetobacter johannae]MBB2176415.1 cobaltochelatase subunit CobT [Gluconacetobacter johannae]GBQ91904.1 cobalamin biosynthesis protein CobT [Gluconacetobacter johannae DSM 13595]
MPDRKDNSRHRHANAAAERADAFKRATVGAVRALGGRATAEVTFQSGPIPPAGALSGDHVRLPQPGLQLPEADIRRLRGAADAAALQLRHHNQAIHDSARPDPGDARVAYDVLEQARVESVGARYMAGVAANLRDRLAQDYRDSGYDKAQSVDQLPIQVALGLLARERLSGEPAPDFMRAIADKWRDHLGAAARRALDDMAATQDDQAAFARAARRLLVACDLIEGEAEIEDSPEGDDTAPSDQAEEEPGEAPEKPRQQEEDGTGQEEDETGLQPQMAQGAGVGDDEADDSESGTASGSDQAGGPRSGEDHDGPDPALAYHAYTTAYDEEVGAEDLCDADELSRLRQQLDQQLVSLQGVVSRLANRLQRRLLAQQTRAWEFDLEEGILDAGRLSRVVVNPTLSLSYKHERDTDFRDTVVTLLIDNSGSMRGRPISVAAMCGDIMARTLERCAVKVEVLGFTTRAWKGGQSRERWVANGKPRNPGRLNDLRHIVYKAADMPWRRARKNLGLMLREGLLKENIDGEALLWAWRRLQGRPESRKILMVISDGAPVDDSTLSVNPGSYLESHLREVIGQIEGRSAIELVAIGIGHDVTRYYRRAVTITDAEELGGTMMQKLSELFDEKAAAAGRRRVA